MEVMPGTFPVAKELCNVKGGINLTGESREDNAKNVVESMSKVFS